MKKCNKCEEEKDLIDFNKNSYRSDGIDSQCKACRKAYKTTRREKDNITRKLNRNKNKDIVNIKQKEYARNNPEWYLLQKAKERSKIKNLDFNIEINDITIPEYCPILEIKLVKGTSKNYQYSPSIDRIDSSKGYVKGNIRVISALANTMKNSASKELLETFSKNILKYIDLDNDIV